MNKIVKVVILSSLFIAPISGFAACDKLNRTIKAGMKGDDVKILQKYLNNNTDTQIAKTGVNSKGKESGVYDIATQKAFKQFQLKNANTILKPAGLKVPNGVVGEGSRKLINNTLCVENSPLIDPNMSDSEASAQAKMYEKRISESLKRFDNIDAKNKSNKNTDILSEKLLRLAAIKEKADSAVKNAVSPEDYARLVSDGMNSNSPESNKIDLQGITPSAVKPGEDMFVFGDRLAATNKVHLGNLIINSNKTKPTDRFIKVTVPIDVAPKSYDVYFENINGVSNKIPVEIRAKLQIGSTPRITSISPTAGNIGTEVLITGTGFTKANLIMTTTKMFKDIVSLDGKTLKFKLEADKAMLDAKGLLSKILPFSIVVRNEKGDSNAMSFKLQ